MELLQCNGVHSTNNNNNTAISVEEPAVADINQHPSYLVSAELQYTVADINIVDTSGLQTSSDLSHITELDNFQEAIPVDTVDKSSSQGGAGIHCVDMTDKSVTASLSNGHPSADDESVNDSVKVTKGDTPTLGKLASKEFDVVIKLDTGEKRFGFSVIGGIDEGFPARVESIAGG